MQTLGSVVEEYTAHPRSTSAVASRLLPRPPPQSHRRLPPPHNLLPLLPGHTDNYFLEFIVGNVTSILTASFSLTVVSKIYKLTCCQLSGVAKPKVR
ncbi:hypothetical protein Taro_024307 [Colocasia esculenta]|uniref:Uncharacterized protein n=1 Tax=Colocasia esculenta TaxID=4460 RepID=A0A843UZZ2_COLES|nr:hypothetical protein [Colocasia esculenta]